MGLGAERSTTTIAAHRHSWGSAAVTGMSPGPDFLLLLLTLLLTTCPTMSLAQSAVRISTTEASSSSRSDFPPTLLTKSAIAYNDGDGDALGNDGDDEPEPFPEPFSVRRSAAIAYIDDDSEALRLDDEAFVFSTSTSTAITATTITSTTTTSYPDTSTYEYCVNDEASCGKDDLCSDCHLLTTSGGSLTCQEAYPAAAASGISSACEQLAATFCCYYGNASAAQRCLGNEPTALYWECVLTGAGYGCSLEDMPCYNGTLSTEQRQPNPSPSPTEAATTAPVQFEIGREIEGVYTASPTGAPTPYDRGSSLAGTASPTPAAPIASAVDGGVEAPAATRSPVADNDDTDGIGAGNSADSTSSGGSDFDGAAEAGDSAACVAWSAATPVPRAVVTLGVALFLAARHAATK